MKKYIALLLLTTLFISCSEDNGRKSETAAFLGQWKMTEVYIDPGDGSGAYEPVTENKIITFQKNGNVTSNYSLCELGISTTGSYSAPYFADEDHIVAKSCGNAADFNIDYHLIDGKLILSYPCFEACGYKFERITED